MRVFVDTNVLLDIPLRRPLFYAASRQALSACDAKGFPVFISCHTPSNLFYILQRSVGAANSRTFLGELLRTSNEGTVGHADARRALKSSITRINSERMKNLLLALFSLYLAFTGSLQAGEALPTSFVSSQYRALSWEELFADPAANQGLHVMISGYVGPDLEYTEPADIKAIYNYPTGSGDVGGASRKLRVDLLYTDPLKSVPKDEKCRFYGIFYTPPVKGAGVPASEPLYWMIRIDCIAFADKKILFPEFIQ